MKNHRVIWSCFWNRSCSTWGKTNKSWQIENDFSTKSIRALWNLYLWVCVRYLDNYQFWLVLALCFKPWELLWNDFQGFSLGLAMNDYNSHPLTIGGTIQYPQWIPKTADSTAPYIYCVPPVYTYLR